MVRLPRHDLLCTTCGQVVRFMAMEHLHVHWCGCVDDVNLWRCLDEAYAGQQGEKCEEVPASRRAYKSH